MYDIHERFNSIEPLSSAAATSDRYTNAPTTEEYEMFTKLKFWEKPSNPEEYLKFLQGIQYQAKLTMEEKCVTLSDSGFNNLAKQKSKVDREVTRVKQIILYKKYHANA